MRYTVTGLGVMSPFPSKLKSGEESSADGVGEDVRRVRRRGFRRIVRSRATESPSLAPREGRHLPRGRVVPNFRCSIWARAPELGASPGSVRYIPSAPLPMALTKSLRRRKPSGAIRAALGRRSFSALISAGQPGQSKPPRKMPSALARWTRAARASKCDWETSQDAEPTSASWRRRAAALNPPETSSPYGSASSRTNTLCSPICLARRAAPAPRRRTR